MGQTIAVSFCTKFKLSLQNLDNHFVHSIYFDILSWLYIFNQSDANAGGCYYRNIYQEGGDCECLDIENRGWVV